MLEAILFDCDGVIADSEECWNQIDREHLQFYGVPDYRGEYKQFVIGKSFYLADAFYREKFGIEATIEEMMQQRTGVGKRFYSELIPTYEGAANVLQQLKEDGLKMALATSTVSTLIFPFLKRHGIDVYFDAIITGEMVKNGKPNPDIYLLAAERIGVKPENCLVVEDALAGLQAGNAAGCQTVAIPDPRWLDVSEFVGKSDYKVENLSMIPNLVRSLRES
jgi:HAD superfamily hydrolase (TIGR01509 family)